MTVLKAQAHEVAVLRREKRSRREWDEALDLGRVRGLVLFAFGLCPWLACSVT